MTKFVIEREIPEIGRSSLEQLRAASQKSCNALQQVGPQVQWVQSYVTDEKLYCIYLATNEAAIREHARLGGFPVNRISRIYATIDPSTAE